MVFQSFDVEKNYVWMFTFFFRSVPYLHFRKINDVNQLLNKMKVKRGKISSTDKGIELDEIRRQNSSRKGRKPKRRKNRVCDEIL